MTEELSSTYFRMLGLLLNSEPSAELMDKLTDGVFEEVFYAQDNEKVLRGHKEMEEWLKSESKEKLLEKACSDYMKLLVGVGKVFAPPWGSVYLNTDRLLFTEDTLKVRQFYERYGRKPVKKYKEPDDHIGLELEFLAYLSERGETEAAVEFAQEFIVPWVFQWNADVQKYAKTGFYKALGNMAAGGVEYFTGNISGSNLL
jgi:TorA maturation chaperone TorD